MRLDWCFLFLWPFDPYFCTRLLVCWHLDQFIHCYLILLSLQKISRSLMYTSVRRFSSNGKVSLTPLTLDISISTISTPCLFPISKRTTPNGSMTRLRPL